MNYRLIKDAHLRALMTRKSRAVWMRNAMLRNKDIKAKTDTKLHYISAGQISPLQVHREFYIGSGVDCSPRLLSGSKKTNYPFATLARVPSFPWRGHWGQQPLWPVHFMTIIVITSSSALANVTALFFIHFLRKGLPFVRSILFIKQHYIYHYTKEADCFNSKGQHHVYCRISCYLWKWDVPALS